MLSTIADFIDLLHIFVAIFMLNAPFLYFTARNGSKKKKILEVFIVFVVVVISGAQIMTFDCPMTLFADYLRVLENPSHDYRNEGFLAWLFQSKLGLPVTANMVALSIYFMAGIIASIFIASKMKEDEDQGVSTLGYVFFYASRYT